MNFRVICRSTDEMKTSIVIKSNDEKNGTINEFKVVVTNHITNKKHTAFNHGD